MSAYNLIPAPRREASARRRLVRGWILAVIGGGIFVGAATLVTFANNGVESQATRDLLAAAQSRVDAARRREQSMRLQAMATSRSLQAARLVGRPPDWNILLSLLAKAKGPNVKNHALRITMPDDAALGAIEQVQVEISGLARSQSAVARYVLDLESSRLFSSVGLAKSDLVEEGVSFRLTGTIDGVSGGRGDQPSPAAPATPGTSANAEAPR